MADTTAPTTAPAPAAPPPAPAPEPKPAEKAEPAADLRSKFDGLKQKAKASPVPKTEPEPKPAEAVVTPDPDLQAVERILAEDRRIKAEAKKIADEKATWSAEKEKEKAALETARAVQAAREKKDAIGALRALGFSDKDIYEGDDSIIFKLAEARAAKPQLDEKQRLEAAINEKLAEKEAAATKEEEKKAAAAKAEKDKKKAEAQAIVEAAREAYSKNVKAIFDENPAKYPTLRKLGKAGKMTYGEITEHAWKKVVATKGAETLTEEQALEEMEKHHAALMKDDEPAPAPAPEKKPPPRGVSINPTWQSQDGAPARPAPVGLKDKFAELKRKAREAQKQ